MKREKIHSFVAVALGAAFAAGAAVADGNTIVLLQESPRNGLSGNTLVVDQTNGTNTLVAGDANGDSPAVQSGTNNTGEIEIDGVDVVVTYSQVSPDASVGNSATVSVAGDGSFGALLQNGFGNEALLDIDGLRALGSIEQTGNDNFGSLTVTGLDAEGRLIQTGNNNNTELTVVGSNVTYEVVGDNLSNAGASPSVISNGGTVVIRQSSIVGN